MRDGSGDFCLGSLGRVITRKGLVSWRGHERLADG
jgi:hypothetical protein